MRERDRLKRLAGPEAATAAARKVRKRAARPATERRGAFSKRLAQAGIPLYPEAYFAAVTAASLLAGAAGSFLGSLLGVALFACSEFYLLSWYLDERVLKRQRKVVPHLAPFIDALAAGLGTGMSLEKAVSQAAYGVPPGLFRSELEVVVTALNQGMPVAEAMGLLRGKIGGREVLSLVVAVGLFASLGGQLLEPFRRLASKIREQQTVADRAARDLVIVKQAFLIIFFLTISAPAALAVLAPDYLKGAFADPIGVTVMQAGMVMVLVSILGFKKITNVRI